MLPHKGHVRKGGGMVGVMERLKF